jgi:hypothetical protein
VPSAKATTSANVRQRLSVVTGSATTANVQRGGPGRPSVSAMFRA